MKKIVLIGASGFVGSALLKEALGRGYKVCAVVRNENHITIRHPRLTVASVDVMDTHRLAVVLSGNDAVISAYNPGWDNPDIYEDTLVGYDSIIYAVQTCGVPRLLVVGGAGSLEVSPGIRLMDTKNIPEKLLPGIKSLAKVYTDYLVPNHEIDWVFFAPAQQLEPGVATHRFRLGKDELIRDNEGVSHISLGDYAVAMMDELEHPRHHYERFTIGY
ncbi:MAG: NAD(P)H-binding protein [Tannerellaceae bacterium]|nr:NAD(P)H-binding protein [Tannerellaceae bacterium]